MSVATSRLVRTAKGLGLAIIVGFVALASRSVRLEAQGPPNGLPPQASAQAEEQLDGDLEAIYIDSNTGGRLVHRLVVGNQRFEMVYEDGNAPDIQHGTRVRVNGRRINNNTLSLRSGGSVSTLSVPANNTFGEQRTLVLLVNFQDNTAAPTSWSAAQSVTFQDVNNFYLENSYGQAWFTGDVAGYFTLPMSSASCDYNTIASLAEQAATNSGINVGAYPRRIFAFPQIGACSWWGLGNVGGSPSRAWVNGSYQLFVVAHELGHNFGNSHSHSQPCDVGGCSSIEYGDNHDIMGNIAPAHTNAFQKERVGWLNYGSSPPIQTVTSSGSYRIDPMATPGVYPKALKILKSGTTAGSRTYYYIEARTSSGFDANAAPGVLVHTGSESSGSTSYQIDLAPTTSDFDAILDAGQTFTDSAIGFSVQTISADSSGATVEVSVNGGSTSPCTAGTPVMTLSPSPSQTTSSGQPVSYTVTVANTDDSSCSASTLAFGAAVPAGWSAGYDQASVTLTPGTSGHALLTVTPPPTAAGSANFTAVTTRSGSTGPGGSVSGSVTVATLATSLNVAVSASNVRSNVQMTASVTADGAAVSGASVTFRLTDPTGSARTVTATTNASGVASASIKLRPKDPAGTYQVRASVSASGLTGSATTTVTN